MEAEPVEVEEGSDRAAAVLGEDPQLEIPLSGSGLLARWYATDVEHRSGLHGLAVAEAVISQRTSWETLRGRYDEHNNKFSLSMKPKFNRPVGERNHF
jgi:hypothetical protein